MSEQLSGTPEPSFYRRVIDWETRLAREGPVLLERLALRSGSRLLDLGSATGEHDRWLAERGIEVVGVDRSAEMIAAAREAVAPGSQVRYVESDLAALPDDLGGGFDAALCVGNTLVHLLEADELRACLVGVASRLEPGGRLLVQILNYESILAERRRTMPTAFRPAEDGGELAFLRFMDHVEPGFVRFESVVLERRPGEPSRIAHVRSSRLRAWTRAELVPICEAAVGPTEVSGTLAGDPFDPARSPDLVLLARRLPS